jgi:thiamine biosynthesis lipoprotein
MKFASTTFSAWSCTVRLTVADPAVLMPAAMDLVREMVEVDGAVSRFRSDSELVAVNRRAGRPVPVSRRLAEYVGIALDAASATDGAVDPTVGRDLVALGYDTDIRTIRDTDRPARVATVGGRRRWFDVHLDRRLNLLTVPVGAALDLGATAKARTADVCARQLAERYQSATLVEIGGDLAVSGAPVDGWPVTVAERAGGPGVRIALHRGGLATSTTTLRRWTQNGAARHHIVDPATGRSTGGRWRTATVAAASAVAANTAATAAIVLGDRAEDWLSANRYTARLVGVDGAVCLVGNWPADALPVPAVA